MNVPPATAAPVANGAGPRGGFKNPEAARVAALAFVYEGMTAADVRDRMGPDSAVLAELAAAMDALAAEDIGQARAREIVHAAPAPADGAR